VSDVVTIARALRNEQLATGRLARELARADVTAAVTAFEGSPEQLRDDFAMAEALSDFWIACKPRSRTRPVTRRRKRRR
jgi:hypothetical protein